MKEEYVKHMKTEKLKTDDNSWKYRVIQQGESDEDKGDLCTCPGESPFEDEKLTYVVVFQPYTAVHCPIDLVQVLCRVWRIKSRRLIKEYSIQSQRRIVFTPET